MTAYRVHWREAADADRGYYADVEAGGEDEAAFLAAQQAQPWTFYAGIVPLTS